MWPLSDRPSLRFVRDIFSAMRNKDVEVELTAEAVYKAPAEVAVVAAATSSGVWRLIVCGANGSWFAMWRWI